jgi:hypothetical protein
LAIMMYVNYFLILLLLLFWANIHHESFYMIPHSNPDILVPYSKYSYISVPLSVEFWFLIDTTYMCMIHIPQGFTGTFVSKIVLRIVREKQHVYCYCMHIDSNIMFFVGFLLFILILKQLTSPGPFSKLLKLMYEL